MFIMANHSIAKAHKATRVSVMAGVMTMILCPFTLLAAQNPTQGLQVKVEPATGSYTIGAPGSNSPVLEAGVAVRLDGRWLQSTDYPRHAVKTSEAPGYLGAEKDWTVTFSGLPDEPDLTYHLRAYLDHPFADIQVVVENSTAKPIDVEAIRPIAASGNSVIDLGGPPLEDRVLSDSLSEDTPALKIRNLADAVNQMHRGFGSQLIYNQQSHRSLFIGALTSDRFLTVLTLHLAGDPGLPHIASYDVDCTGMTQAQERGDLRNSPPQDWMPLKLSLAPGAKLPSETLLVSVDKDYHGQLETYGSLVRKIHHARVTATAPMGWWSWTAYFNRLNAGEALTNAQWLAQHLKSLGYHFFFIDDGYMYARGEYLTADATLFPHGMESLERKVHGLGLTPGVWTAPFEVSERSWVYQHHKDWLVHNAQGEPIQIGSVMKGDRLFVLDCTNPGAQNYLRMTYSTMVNVWGIRLFKLDFMKDSAIEGDYYRPNTTAMEAQRIGLGIIRQAVGEHVLLDKDGSTMLNPVGYVDLGRISQDLGPSFAATKDAATGIAARYYMNRNFYVTDPDSFTVSKEFRPDHRSWHGGTRPLTLDEAKVSIAMAAVAGGMYEEGDDLPTLGSEPKRLALAENTDLIDMDRLGKASIPEDLMTYLPQDEQPSIFFLREDDRQSILTIFNWTDHARSHVIRLADFGLEGKGPYTIHNVLDKEQIPVSASNSVGVEQPLHSVRVLKIVNTGIAPQVPTVQVQHPSRAKAGVTVEFAASASDSRTPVLSYRWNFGDGVILKGAQVSHAYTRAGDYQVKLTAAGLDGLTAKKDFRLPVTGTILTTFLPVTDQKRYHKRP